MTTQIRLACQPKVVPISPDKILPTRSLTPDDKQKARYQRIAASIESIGIIEPLVVFPQPGQEGFYILLDGHVRLSVLRDLGESQIPCLISNDDDSFTHNHKVNRVTAVQEHFMVLKAVENGVSEEQIAMTLKLDVASIRKKVSLLEGICPEAVHLIKDRGICAGAVREMRKVKPMRQIEIAELMSSVNNYSVVYAKCMVAATPAQDFIESEKPKNVRGLTPADIARMERESATLTEEFKVIEESFGKNTLSLVIVTGYLKKLLDNARVVRYLSQNHAEILAEFQKVIETKNFKEAV